MLDVNLIIPPMVEDIIVLEPHFPEIVPSFPLGILTPLDGGADTIISGEERLTTVRFQTDVYHTSQQLCEEYAVRISARLVKRGFMREGGQILKENGLHRHTLTFSGVVDERTNYIFRR